MARKGNERIAEIRRKVNEQRKIEEVKRKRNRLLIQSAVVALVVLVVGGIAWATVAMNNAARGSSEPPEASGTVTVAGAPVPFEVGGTAVRLGAEDAPVRIDLWEDFSCPHCAEYEASVGGALEELVAEGDTMVTVHPIKVVSDYGIRAGSVSACVAESDPQNWLSVRAALFAAHDSQTDGWQRSDFLDLVSEAGVSDQPTLDCVSSGDYENWIRQNSEAASEAGVTGTPTLFINGKKTELLNAEGLHQIVDDVLTGK